MKVYFRNLEILDKHIAANVNLYTNHVPELFIASGSVLWDKLEYDRPTHKYEHSDFDYFAYFFHVIDTVYDFFLYSSDTVLQRQRFAYMWVDGESLESYIVNNVEDDGLIYVFLFGLVNPITNKNGQAMGCTPDLPYVDHKELLDFFRKKQLQLNGDPVLSQCKGKVYFSSTPAELLDEFMPCFEECLTDIPADSIMWKTPFLIGVMKKFKALKEYRLTLT